MHHGPAAIWRWTNSWSWHGAGAAVSARSRSHRRVNGRDHQCSACNLVRLFVYPCQFSMAYNLEINARGPCHRHCWNLRHPAGRKQTYTSGGLQKCNHESSTNYHLSWITPSIESLFLAFRGHRWQVYSFGCAKNGRGINMTLSCVWYDLFRWSSTRKAIGYPILHNPMQGGSFPFCVLI